MDIPRGGDIVTQEQFDRAWAQLPRPITEESRRDYHRLRALAYRRGFAMPYRIYIHPLRRRSPQGLGVARG